MPAPRDAQLAVTSQHTATPAMSERARVLVPVVTLRLFGGFQSTRHQGGKPWSMAFVPTY